MSTTLNRSAPTSAVPILMSALVGVLLGGAVSILAFLLARYGPSGGNWSFKGNGALAAYSIFPAVLAGGWAALVLHMRGHPQWLRFGFVAGLVGLGLAAADAALLPLFGSNADRTAGPVLLLLLAIWVVVAPIAATRIRVTAATAIPGAGMHLAAGAVWLAAALGGVILFGTLLPPGS